jgi:hypothetical protein
MTLGASVALTASLIDRWRPFLGTLCAACNLSWLRATGDPYQILAYDFLHNWDLGMVKYLVDGIKGYLQMHTNTPAAAKQLLRELDRRLCLMPRAEGLALPT